MYVNVRRSSAAVTLISVCVANAAKEVVQLVKEMNFLLEFFFFFKKASLEAKCVILQ